MGPKYKKRKEKAHTHALRQGRTISKTKKKAK